MIVTNADSIFIFCNKATSIGLSSYVSENRHLIGKININNSVEL